MCQSILGGILISKLEEENMGWGEGVTRSVENGLLWCLVVDKCHCDNTLVTILAETPEARDRRHAGESSSDSMEVIRELDEELNYLINQTRSSGHHDKLLSLIAVVCNESSILEGKRIRERQANSRIA